MRSNLIQSVSFATISKVTGRVFSLILSASTCASAEPTLGSDAILSRVSRAFQSSELTVSVDSATTAAAFRAIKGKQFSAISCLQQVTPRIGCERMSGTASLVQAVPITLDAIAGKRSLRSLQILNGTWIGAHYAIRIDAARSQANIDPRLPFKWQRFSIKEAKQGEVTFNIGGHIFHATLQSNRILLTSTSFRTVRVLERETSIFIERR